MSNIALSNIYNLLLFRPRMACLGFQRRWFVLQHATESNAAAATDIGFDSRCAKLCTTSMFFRSPAPSQEREQQRETATTTTGRMLLVEASRLAMLLYLTARLNDHQ
jgi:hypothetical protein